MTNKSYHLLSTNFWFTTHTHTHTQRLLLNFMFSDYLEHWNLVFLIDEMKYLWNGFSLHSTFVIFITNQLWYLQYLPKLLRFGKYWNFNQCYLDKLYVQNLQFWHWHLKSTWNTWTVSELLAYNFLGKQSIKLAIVPILSTGMLFVSLFSLHIPHFSFI